MIWMLATALGAPPGVLMVSGEDDKILAKARKTTLMPGLEAVESDDLGLDAFLGRWGDLCSVAVSEEVGTALTALHTDRPELWVSREGAEGMGLWKWEPAQQLLKMHEDSEGADPMPADVLVLQWGEGVPELSEKSAAKLVVHSDIAVRAAAGTQSITDQLMKEPNECIPNIDGEALTAIEKLRQEGRELYIAAVPPKGKPVLWRWDKDINGLKRI